MQSASDANPSKSDDSTVTRRTLIKGGLIVAATGLALPTAGATAATLLTPREPAHDPPLAPGAPGAVMATLAGYMKDAQKRALPADAVEHTKLHVLDTLAAMVSGSDLAPGHAALTFANAYGGAPIATVIRSKTLVGPIEAALANAMMAHADETDDSHAPSESHPGCSIVPAALAAGERFHNDGMRFLRAVALGYDIGTRLTMSLGVANFEVGTHQSSHAIAGTWGSTAAAGCAAGLSVQQLPWLLAYAADQSSGLTVWQRDTDHIQKAFAFAGMGARNGVTAALLVHSGWTGVDDVLTGQYNFFNAYAPNGDPSKLIDKLGERYEITRTNIKKWSVGSPIQAPLDALQNLRAKHPFEADQVRSVVIRAATSELNLVDNRDMPDICMQHLVAVMLVDKTVSFRSAHDKAEDAGCNDFAAARQGHRRARPRPREAAAESRGDRRSDAGRWDQARRTSRCGARNRAESDAAPRGRGQGARSDGARPRRRAGDDAHRHSPIDGDRQGHSRAAAVAPGPVERCASRT